MDADTVMTITIKDFAPVTLAPLNVPLSEKLVVQKATGMAYESFLSDEVQIGELSAAVMWWLARRAGGEPMLTWAQVQKDWPSPITVEDIDVSVSLPTDEASDPEA